MPKCRGHRPGSTARCIKAALPDLPSVYEILHEKLEDKHLVLAFTQGIHCHVKTRETFYLLSVFFLQHVRLNLSKRER